MNDSALFIEETMSARAFAVALNDFVLKHPKATITIRQTEGTDFPPFISVETSAQGHEFDKNEQYKLI